MNEQPVFPPEEVLLEARIRLSSGQLASIRVTVQDPFTGGEVKGAARISSDLRWNAELRVAEACLKDPFHNWYWYPITAACIESLAARLKLNLGWMDDYGRVTS